MPGVGYGVEEAFESGRTTAIFGRSAAFAIDISGILGFALHGLDLFDGDDMFPIVAHVVGIEELTNAAVEQGTELGVFGGKQAVIVPVGIEHAVMPFQIGRASCRERVCQYV